MKYSEERITTLAFKIHNALYHDNHVTYKNDDKSLRFIKDVMLQYFHIEDEVDTFVQDKLRTTKKNLVPGSSEYKILYNKYFEEEARKRGM